MSVFYIPNINERDVDLLLVQELVESKTFRDWFITQCGFESLEVSSVEVRKIAHSVNTANGESDLELHFKSKGEGFAVLVENKINALMQPTQDTRYQERADTYDATCRTVLIAPLNYAKTTTYAFNERISYEDIREWFFKHKGEESYAVALLDAALDPSKRYVLIADDPNTEFWHDYWLLCETLAPELKMRTPEIKPAGSSFVYFHDADCPDGTVLVHKFMHGNLDIQIAGCAAHTEKLTKQLGAICVVAGKSAAVRLQVPKLNPNLPFIDQKDDVITCIRAAAERLKWLKLPEVIQGIEKVCGTPPR